MMKSFSFAVALLVARTFPAISSSCTGSTPDWMDAAGDGCEWYEAYDTPGCPRYGNLYGGEMGVANSNCCYCEGTGAPTVAPPTYSPTPKPSPSCTGSTPNWVDSFGDGCDWYESVDTPGCPRWGNLYEGDMGVANGNCCYCEDTIRAPSYYPSYVPTGVPAGQEPTRAPSYYQSYVPTGAGADGDANIPSSAPTPSNDLPSSTPDGASYYQSFEVGTFPFADDEGDPIWSTTNLDAPTLIWEVSDEEAATGIYSLKNPILDNEPNVPSQTNLTLIMPDQGSGALHFSVLAGNQMPFDQFEYSVDGVSRGFINDPRTEWEELVLQVGPGAHIFDFVYKFNPHNIPALGFPPPEAFPERTGLVYVDDVYFVPIETLGVEITMGGFLKATNLIVPQTGTDEMLNLAIAFEQTLLGVLSDSYVCDVYMIDGVQVGSDSSYSSRVRNGVFNRQRHLQEVVEEANIFFNCQVTRPCPDCTQMDAVMTIGSQVFQETFDILHWANDGELTSIFCTLANVAQVVPIPCSVEITSVVGLGLDFVRPGSSSPTRAPSYYPSSYYPSDVPTGAPGAGNTITVSPAGQEPTRAPSYYPSYVPTGADGAASIPSSAPTPSNGTSSDGPTTIPVGALYYDGFERATFWSTNNEDGVWELTTERAASGIYSIKSPDLSNEAYTPSSSNVTLSFLDPDFGGGTLILSIMPGIVEPFDNLEYFVNGDIRGVLLEPKEDGEFEILEISLQEGPQEITFKYNYNPYSLDALPPSPPDMIGTVYIDDVYIEPIDAGEVQLAEDEG